MSHETVREPPPRPAYTTHVLCEVFLVKNQKFFKGGKIRNHNEERFLKKCFLLKKGSLPKWEQQNMAVVAGRLVTIGTQGFLLSVSYPAANTELQ